MKNSNTYDELSSADLLKRCNELHEQVKDLEASITYSKRIQNALCSSESDITAEEIDHFLLFQPRDSVSGDFFWYQNKFDVHYFAVADCTGHGVPGALMSIISHNLLNQAVNEFAYDKPGDILRFVNKRHFEIFNKNNKGALIRDGMDIALCKIDLESEILEFSGALRPLYLFRGNGSFEEVKGTRTSIGQMYSDRQEFQNHYIELEKNDTIFLFSDGYADQFGGLRGKKFKSIKFKKLLSTIAADSAALQLRTLSDELKSWMEGGFQQNDDITVLGLNINELAP